MWNKRLLVAVVMVFTLNLLGSDLIAGANSIADLEQKQKDLDKKRSEANTGISEMKDQLATVLQDKDEAEAQIIGFDMQIGKTATKIDETIDQIEKLEVQIKDLSDEIAELEIQIMRRDEKIRDRVVATQELGGSSRFMEVIFGAKTFAQFIERYGYVSKLLDADHDIITEQKNDQDRLEVAKEELETSKADQVALKEKHEAMMVDLEKQKEQKEELIKQLDKTEAELQADLGVLEADSIMLANESAAIEEYIKEEKRKAAEEEAKRIAAEEEAKRKAEAAAKANNSNNSPSSSGNGSGSSSSGGGSTSVAPPASNGMFIKPTQGVVTSRWGPRWGSFHYGIDIARSGTVPIRAAADGIVTVSQYSPSSGYGEMIMIQHVINGKVYTTLYAHMRHGSRTVRTGQVVKQGETIGLMGSTGFSTGQHLHLELAIPTWRGDKSTHVNPAPYFGY